MSQPDDKKWSLIKSLTLSSNGAGGCNMLCMLCMYMLCMYYNEFPYVKKFELLQYVKQYRC